MAGTRGALTIGALSAATGVPVATIRTWERRYGFPVPERKPSGHRVYPLSIVPRLRLIAQVLARGHRAAEVVPATERALEALLATEAQSAGDAVQREAALVQRPSGEPTDFMAAVHAFDAERLRRGFQLEWARRGPFDFADQCAAPFLHALGEAWASGELEVRHEHFASAVLGDFLRTVRLPLDERAQGPVVALATLTGERHALGLQLCALVFALAGWRSLVLGADTPADQISALAREAPLGAVALSCVIEQQGNDVRALRALRRRLPRKVPLLVGGAAASPTMRATGIEVMSDLRSLDHWLAVRS